MLKRPKILKNRTRRFAIPNILFGIDSKKNTAPQKSKFHRSFTENDLRHPLIQKNMKMNLSPTTRRLKKLIHQWPSLIKLWKHTLKSIN